MIVNHINSITLLFFFSHNPSFDFFANCFLESNSFGPIIVSHVLFGANSVQLLVLMSNAFHLNSFSYSCVNNLDFDIFWLDIFIAAKFIFFMLMTLRFTFLNLEDPFVNGKRGIKSILSKRYSNNWTEHFGQH